MTSPIRFMTGLLGQGIARSASPALHEREADEHNVRLVYSLYDFDKLRLDSSGLPQIIDSAAKMGFAGLNVTHPFKQTIIPHLDELDEFARKIGAVNTVTFEKGKSIGHNTDSFGFAESLRRGLPSASLRKVVLVGTGGAGSAVAHALLSLGVEHLVLNDQDHRRAGKLAASLSETYASKRINVAADISDALSKADGLVNATPVGMAAYPGSPIPEGSMRSEQWVADIIYAPLETQLLRQARALGCRTINGTGMVVFQAAAAFNLFTGLHADGERMLRKFTESLIQSHGSENAPR